MEAERWRKAVLREGVDYSWTADGRTLEPVDRVVCLHRVFPVADSYHLVPRPIIDSMVFE